MSLKVLLALGCQTVVVGLAWTLTRRRIEHRPFAAWASAMLAVDVARWIFGSICPWLNHAGPWTGWRRVLFHIHASALFNAWAIGLAALAWVVFLRRRPWVPLLAGAAVVAALIIGYPAPFRGELLARAYAVIEAAALATTAAAVLIWARRHPFPRPEHAAVMLVALVDLADFSGPLVLPAPWVEWATGDSIALAMWVALLAMHAWTLLDGFLMLPEPPKRAGLH